MVAGSVGIPGIGLIVAFVLLTIPTILAASFVAAIGPGESAVRARLVEALEYE